ncbi:spatacsin isoform X2 [Strongylocentrotus purpuratus]|uniref:Spatacsin C-terminal domain-containing protein n=1 Tax=Strongylocentrotus purpuratus TaxID=7668 RepID=A0A7M7N9S9_STRPU|nr:spatacsin isoform X2 [Strongylocentrotus purpuratus]
MPYFADSSLIERYAYTEAFSYTYYLRQGRPSFAYTTFITSLLQDGNVLTKKILFEVYVKAYTTAVRSFTNPSICAACTAFIEMLGRDSLSLRTDLQAVRTIADHLKGQLTPANRSGVKGQQGVSLEKNLKEKKETVERDMVNLMMSCVKGSDLCAKSVLRKLEEALISHIDQQNIDRVSWKAAEEWNLAVMFCRLHGIALTTVFPVECTRADNWLIFICFIQTHQYPKQQVLDFVKSFKSSTIKEHMSHALSHLQYGPAPSQDTESTSQGGVANVRSKMPIKDYRSAYYTKMGFLKDGADASAETSDTEDEEDKSGSRLEASHDELSTTDTDTVKDLEVGDVSRELFDIIFTCGNHSEPWKVFLSHSILLQQPVLAVIAACHQGANILDCLCSWLYTSFSDDPNLERVLGPSSFFKSHAWSLDQLRSLIDIAMVTGKITLLTKGFHIFDNRGVLNSFLAFCEDFLVLRDRNQCKIDLEFFHEAILTCRRRNSMRNQPDPGPSRPRIGHLEWFQETANHMARNMLLSCTSQWETGFLLEVFTALNFSRTVDSHDPDYSTLYHLHKALQGTGLELSISCMLDSAEAMVSECRTLLDRLQAMGQFDRAKEFAGAAGLSTDHVIIQQILSDLRQVMRSEVGSTEAGRIAFWVKCSERLTKAKVEHQSAAQFFQTQSEEEELTGNKQARERAILLDLSYQWLSHPKSTPTKSSLRSLEQKVWLWRLRAEVDKKRKVDTASLSCLESHSADWTPKSRGPRELLYDVQTTDTSVHQLLNEEEKSALKDMIDGLLSSCCISKAHQLSSQFGHTHNDLSITLACLQLMQGKVKPEGIDPELRSQVKVSKPKLARRPSNMTLLGPPSGVYGGRSKKQLRRSPSVVSLGINQELSSPQSDDCLTMMEALADHTSAARTCCDRIINIYRISQVLDKPYDLLIKQVPFTSVKALLHSSHPDRYLLAKSFIRANNLADKEVANFLSEDVMTGLQQKIKRRKESSLTRPPPSEGPSPDRMEKVAFMSLARICKDPACLGTRLLDEATQIAHSESSTTRPALTLEVDLIIRAHDCFTLSCNMEGIASVLRASLDCFSALAQSEEFSLMVRLLIGVRRFTDMTYIFEIL